MYIYKSVLYMQVSIHVCAGMVYVYGIHMCKYTSRYIHRIIYMCILGMYKRIQLVYIETNICI